MRSELPLHVLGLLAPILSWVESSSDRRLPESWLADSLSPKDRERVWLVGELPTYSHDNVAEIVRLARQARRDRENKRPLKERRWPPPDKARRLVPPHDYHLTAVFSELGERYFVWNGGKLCVREGYLEELHELGLRFPLGHLIRHQHALAVAEGFLSDEQVLELPEQASFLSTNSYGLRTLLRRGLSESHLHLKGVTSTEENWADSILRPLGADVLKGFEPVENRLLTLNRYSGQLLALAVLCGFYEYDEFHPPFHLLACLDDMYFARNRFEERRARELLAKKFRNTLCRESGRRSEEGIGIPGSEVLHRNLPAAMTWLLRWLSPASYRLQQILHAGPGYRHPPAQGTLERIRSMERLHFHAHKLLVRLDREDRRAVFLHQALFRYLVYRTHHWQLAIQHGKTTGLQNFRRFFGARQRKPLDPDTPELQRLVFDRLRRWDGLRALEGRISPPEKGGELMRWVAGYARMTTGGQLRKFGLVVHFIKEDQRDEERRALGLGYPTVRWSRLRRKFRAQAFQLFRTLSECSPATPFIVGIDAANLELATPPEVFAPAFRFLRELPIELRVRSRSFPDRHCLDREIRYLADKKRLGMTYHVGEDFRHILSGLRAIYEVMEFLNPQPGDRLGHGTALALKPEIWAEQCGYQAVVPKLEWLDTLVWVHHFLGPGHDLMGELEIEDKIQRLSWHIYGNPGRKKNKGEERGWSSGKDWSPLALLDAWRLRQLDPDCLDRPHKGGDRLRIGPLRQHSEQHRRWWHVQKKVLRDVGKHVGSGDAYRLLCLYWYNPEVRERGDQVMLVDLQERPEHKDLWLRLCRDVGKKLRERVHRRQLVVEVNPSVNRVIGPMARLDQHHIFEMTLDENDRLARSVRVSINTDNPAVCNTTLAHEYHLLGEALMRRGVPEAEVVKWLEWLRSNGEEYSFVRQLPESDEPHMARLLDVLNRLPTSVREASTGVEKLRAFRTWHRRPPYASRVPSSPEDLQQRLHRAEERIRRMDSPEDLQRRLLDRAEEEIRRLNEKLSSNG